MTTIEDWSLVDQVAADPHPLSEVKRADIINAFIEAASDHGGEVHASWVRPYLPVGVNEHLIGNVASQLSRKKILQRTGRYLPSGDARNRNRLRDLPVRRVVNWDALWAEVNR